MYKNYRYKVAYKTFGLVGSPKEVKMDTYEELEGFLGSIVMIAESVDVYRKVKGVWEMIRHIEGRIFWTEEK